MTVEELQAELQGTLQTIKSYIDSKDGNLNGKIEQLQQTVENLSGVDEDTLTQIQDLLQDLDADKIAQITQNTTKLGNLINGLAGLKGYADTLFSLQ